jgi:PncC family amidohydrolase
MSNTPLKEVADFMAAHSLILATAESCTAGLIASHLAEVPGAGELLESACITYSPGAKQRRLGVRPETIERFNLTSEQVAGEMAQGVLRSSQANLAIANTGVTDDTDPTIAAGTQCFAWLFAERAGRPPRMFTETKRFTGERNEIREQAARHALSRIPVYYPAFMGEDKPENVPERDFRNLRAQAAESS